MAGKKKASEASRNLSRPRAVAEGHGPDDGLSSGCTLLNMALTGNPDAAFYPGKYYLFVGDSSSGKTWLTLTCFAEAAASRRFSRHRLIHDNPEDGALMDLTRYFGGEVQRRMEPPAGTRERPRFSHTVQELYDHLDAAFTAGIPFIYVVDSMDALNDEESLEATTQARKVRQGGKGEAKGTYGVAKAKVNSAGMREVFAKLRDSGSIIIFISQTRDNVSQGAMFKPKVRAGGLALTFFATAEMWTSVAERLSVRVAGKDRRIGIVARIVVKKNRQTGEDTEVRVPLLKATGIDDVGACVDYLVDEGFWDVREAAVGRRKVRLIVPEGIAPAAMIREDVVAHVENNDLEDDLRALVARRWREINALAEPVRKRRYE